MSWLAGVYAIVDVDAWRRAGVELSDHGVLEGVTEALLAGGVSIVQLRAKNEHARVVLGLLQRMLIVTRPTSIPLVANDRADLARLAGADGLHLGQDDLPIQAARTISSGLRIGVSTHDLPQLQSALLDLPDYIAFGPVFATANKAHPDPTVGLALLAQAAAESRSAKLPLVAIGGITQKTIGDVVRAGADACAVIGALVATQGRGGPDYSAVELRARELGAAFPSAGMRVTPNQP